VKAKTGENNVVKLRKIAGIRQKISDFATKIEEKVQNRKVKELAQSLLYIKANAE